MRNYEEFRESVVEFIQLIFISVMFLTCLNNVHCFVSHRLYVSLPVCIVSEILLNKH